VGNNILDKRTTILIVLIVILVGVLGFAGGYILYGNQPDNNDTSAANQTNVTVNNTSQSDSNSDADNASNEQPHNDVPYRITSNTPDCPNCGSNNIAQLADTEVDTSTDEWVVQSKCRYCGYRWEYRVSQSVYS
jgi:nitrate reductase cytochrome c-type subunit